VTFSSVGRRAELEHMRAIQKYDDESLSDSSEMTVQEHQKISWRKPMVVGACAALVVAAIVVFKQMPVRHGEVAQNELIELASDGCSSDTENCMETKCCAIAGRKCFMKNQYWANCNDDCDKNFVDSWDKEHNITDGWDCTELKKEQEKGPCAKDSEDCSGKSGCCSENHVCYIKNEHWKNCNPTCKTGVGANEFEHGDYKHQAWSCEIYELGQYCPEAKLSAASDPAEHQKCCKDTFCKDKSDDECETEICAFYYQSPANATTTATANATTTATPNATTAAPA